MKFPQNLKKYLTKLTNSNNTFKPTLVQKFSRIKVYNALAIPILVYGSEIWTLGKKKDKKTIDISRDESFQVNRQVHPF